MSFYFMQPMKADAANMFSFPFFYLLFSLGNQSFCTQDSLFLIYTSCSRASVWLLSRLLLVARLRPRWGRYAKVLLVADLDAANFHKIQAHPVFQGASGIVMNCRVLVSSYNTLVGFKLLCSMLE